MIQFIKVLTKNSKHRIFTLNMYLIRGNNKDTCTWIEQYTNFDKNNSKKTMNYKFKKHVMQIVYTRSQSTQYVFHFAHFSY